MENSEKTKSRKEVISEMIYQYGELCKSETRAYTAGQEDLAQVFKDCHSVLCRYLEKLTK